ncbi:MAG: aminopeptidase P family protein [Duncaniella sp.]|nr:aminopeptidase P family protein [Duncaniella sp.]HBI58526.1 peptidase M24 [Porphyromonadaceae bacterium]
MQNIHIERLVELRKEMEAAHVDAVIIPQTDPHQSEYVASHWQVRRFFSGFTGSAGTLVVTRDAALLWTDSRYFLQAAAQLDGTGIILMKDGLPETPSITEYLVDNLAAGTTVGINGMLFSINDTATMRHTLNSAGIALNVDFDPIDTLWPDRPSLPADKAYVHELKYAGKTPAEKIAVILDNVRAQGADSVLISALDEIAWALNLRSSDVHCSPVAMSFLYLAPEGSTLFINDEKLTPQVVAHLAEAGVTAAPYASIKNFLASLPATARVLLGTSQSSGTLAAILGDRYIPGTSPVAMPKACKNPVQIEGIRAAHHRDGVAMVRSLIEIERLINDRKEFTEIDVADILLRNRRTQELFVDTSFDTIAGYGPNGAIVHYSATPESNTTVLPGNLLLIDSGGNYLDGTTDITRTIAIGTPTAAMRHDFTLVMKGHIAIATAVFPEGTRGAQLDAMARMPLWKEGKSYLHGTGHGVGHFLNCHEGPQSIRLNDTMAPLTPGMLTSNEPGVYLAGRYGIRCENLIVTVEKAETEFGRFYAFDTVTLCPFDRMLFDTSIMTADEIAWVNNYHATVYRELSPLLTSSEAAWLRSACAPIN